MAGSMEGCMEGTMEGFMEGCMEGCMEGSMEGLHEGSCDHGGLHRGCPWEFMEGFMEGCMEECMEGFMLVHGTCLLAPGNWRRESRHSVRGLHVSSSTGGAFQRFRCQCWSVFCRTQLSVFAQLEFCVASLTTL